VVGFDRDAAPFFAHGTTGDQREAGFTLVEVLVAFAILSIVLLTLFGGLSTALFGDRRAEFTRSALRLAKAELETAGVDKPLTPGVTIGRFENGMEWRLSVQPYALAAPSATPAYWVEIIVRPPSGSNQSSFVSALAAQIAPMPSVALTTLKLVTSPQ
jgi:prepilin-type N-terminal cleavage/methylation domain-containing protein